MGASSHEPSEQLTSLEICAGAGGQAIGLEQAGFRHLALVEYDKYAHATLEKNIKRECDERARVERALIKQGYIKQTRSVAAPQAFHEDVIGFGQRHKLADLDGHSLKRGDLDLLAGGVPCPPFSKAGQQLGKHDERDLFPEVLKLVSRLKPKAVMIENVRGLMDAKFDKYREDIIDHLTGQGYRFCGWQILEAHNFGVPQLRPRSVLVAIKEECCEDARLGDKFPWPAAMGDTRYTVYQALRDSMVKRRRVLKAKFPERAREIDKAYARWRKMAQLNDNVAPTLVGGSRKHGGADLGPSRAKKAWESLGINAHGVANEAAECTDLERDFLRPAGPMLTASQAAKIQGFPDEWEFVGRKTAKYRQVGNAFPPPVAKAVGLVIASVLRPERKEELLKGLLTEYITPQRASAYSQAEFEVAEDLSASLVSPAPTDDRSDLVGADA